MIITKEMIKAEGPCEEGYKWFIDHNLGGKEIGEIVEHLIRNNLKITGNFISHIDTAWMTGYEWAEWLLYAFRGKVKWQIIIGIKLSHGVYDGTFACNDPQKVEKYLRACVKMITE